MSAAKMYGIAQGLVAADKFYVVIHWVTVYSQFSDMLFTDVYRK